MTLEQLNKTKEALLEYRKIVLQTSKRVRLVYHNTTSKNKENENIVILLNSFDEIFNDFSFIEEEYLSKITESHSNSKLSENIRKNLSSYIANEITFGESLYDEIEETLDLTDNAELYETTKLIMKQCKKVLIDIPNKILNNNLNCELYTPDCDDQFNPKTMIKAQKVDSIIVNSVEDLEQYDELGDFVDACYTPAIIDKATGKVLQKAVVDYYSIGLPTSLNDFNHIR